MGKQSQTSWESSAKWYDSIVGIGGHYYHENVIFPKLLNLMNLKEGDRLLDLGCGQGILGRKIPKKVFYTGVDLSPTLIKEAKAKSDQKFVVADITKKLPISEKGFSHVCILLALQNIAEPFKALKNAGDHLEKGGDLFLVLNHPCFRVPRLSHWGVDEQKTLQYRRMDLYMSDQKIPITTHPGKQGKSTQTWSFHHPLSSYVKWIKDAGFCITNMEEWISDKESVGKKKKMEDRARKEFPLFLSLVCKKLI